MNEGDDSTTPQEVPGADTETEPRGASEGGPTRGAVRWALESGAVALLGGAYLVFRGLGAVASGKRLRGFLKALAGAGLLALGRSQWRDRPGMPLAGPGAATATTSGSRTAASEGTTAGESSKEKKDELREQDTMEEQEEEGQSAGEGQSATATEHTADAAAPVQGRSPVPGTAKPSPAGPDVEVLGASAFDGHGLELPVPQRAFNQGFLSPGEVFWGVRLTDGAVVVSDLFDPIWEDEDFHYLGSSEVGEDRTLRIPDAVLDNWDRVYDGGDAVVGGDDLTFLTTPTLAERDQLRVVPEAWRDVVLGEGGEA